MALRSEPFTPGRSARVGTRFIPFNFSSPISMPSLSRCRAEPKLNSARLKQHCFSLSSDLCSRSENLDGAFQRLPDTPCQRNTNKGPEQRCPGVESAEADAVGARGQ